MVTMLSCLSQAIFCIAFVSFLILEVYLWKNGTNFVVRKEEVSPSPTVSINVSSPLQRTPIQSYPTAEILDRRAKIVQQGNYTYQYDRDPKNLALGLGTWKEADSPYHVYLDWNVHSKLFTYINYKSLESLLSVYPKGTYFEVMIPGPIGARVYKFDSVLSIPYFDKYKRMGYHLSVIVQYAKIFYGGHLLPSTYVREEMNRCCRHKVANDISRKQVAPSFHILFLFRLFNLYIHGGVFTDFSWIHRRPLFNMVGVKNGVLLRTVCRHGGSSDSSGSGNGDIQISGEESRFSSESRSSYDTGNNDGAPHGCTTSTLMKFERSHPVAACMLNQYGYESWSLKEYALYFTRYVDYTQQLPPSNLKLEADVTMKKNVSVSSLPLLRCFASDRELGGAQCLWDAFKACFRATKVRNQLSNSYRPLRIRIRSSKDNASQKSAMAETIAVYPPAQNLSMLSSEKLWKRDASSISDDLGSFPITLMQRAKTAVICLGSSAYMGDWQIPVDGSPLHVLLGEIELTKNRSVDLFALEMVRKNQACGERTGIYDPKSITTYFNTSSSSSTAKAILGLAKDRRSQQYSCNRYYHGNSDPADYKSGILVRQAESSCAPDFVVPGFMKAGSTFLFNLLASHPQVLRPLRGNGFKETGCYLEKRMVENSSFNRVNCFPFIEPSDHASLIYGDGSIMYVLRKHIPLNLKRDNPNIKALFVAIQARGQGDINNMVSVALDPTQGNLVEFRALALKVLDLPHGNPYRLDAVQALVAAFYEGLRSKKYGETGNYRLYANFIMQSIYFPPVFYWREQLGAENVKVVSVEGLKRRLDQYSSEEFTWIPGKKYPPSLKEQMKGIYSFLGVCAWEWGDHPPRVAEHKTLITAPAAAAAVLNESIKQKLKDFFEPFNVLLFDLIGEDFGY